MDLTPSNNEEWSNQINQNQKIQPMQHLSQFSLILLSLCISLTMACTCLPSTPEEIYCRADGVVTVRVLSISPAPDGFNIQVEALVLVHHKGLKEGIFILTFSPIFKGNEARHGDGMIIQIQTG